MFKLGAVCWRTRKLNVEPVFPVGPEVEERPAVDEIDSPTPCQRLSDQSLAALRSWSYELGASLFFAVCMLAFVFVGPRPCTKVLECAAAAEAQLAEANSMNSHIAVGTGTLLGREVLSFVLSRALSLDQRIAAFPDMLRCTLLAILMCTQTLFALGMS
mmetsp:Transcript_92529/g.297420  ORF Transcript_92529/g.297420 Transcript_92529/m.297420 type:complete len:159 (-) Transcript_92529:1-477(-)